MKTHRTLKAAGAGLAVALLAATQPLCGAQNEKPAVTPAPDTSITAPARALSRAFEHVATTVRPAVVSVYSEKMVKMSGGDFPLPFGNDFFGQFFNQDRPQFQQPPTQRRHEYKVPRRGMGSGMLLDQEGRILTNYHVVRDVDEIKVQLADKREFPAEVVGTDPKTDIAIIRIRGKVPGDVRVVKFGDSDMLNVGDWVLAVGAPFGLTQTVTAGIISAKGRADMGIEDYEDFLQTDAAINPGNSGGPLVNMEGEVIGMNTAIASQSGQFAGVGFAIPINMVKGYLPTLVKGGSIDRGFLGVIIQDITGPLAKQFNLPEGKGALVAQVNKDSPAGKAGLKAGDAIVRLDGKVVEDSRSLRKLVAATPPDAKVDLGIVRDGREKTVSLTLGRMPDAAVAGTKPADTGSLEKLGLNVQTLTPQLGTQFGYAGQKGVLVADVEFGSVAALANMQSGDLITEANRKAVTTVDELRNVVAASKDSVLLLVRRKEASLFVVLNL